MLAGKYRHELVALAHAEEAHKIGLLAFSTSVLAVLRRRGRYQFSLERFQRCETVLCHPAGAISPARIAEGPEGLAGLADVYCHRRCGVLDRIIAKLRRRKRRRSGESGKAGFSGGIAPKSPFVLFERALGLWRKFGHG
jgi:hypothetical protein